TKPVQLIKDTEHNAKPFIQFPTELVNSQHHSLIPLLPQSPPPSTSLSLPLQLLHKNFPHHKQPSQPLLKQILPTYPPSLINHQKLMRQTPRQTSKNLHLNT
ncbi:malate:quinone oxidoreductase, partial [Staphylococcus epidermidis]|uniref:malate:quinone oxidoreductase n=1 Tax=Staphylococcus epidermidis TaxID=1282 RepID=UPI00164286DA